jgi:hypothetical protein
MKKILETFKTKWAEYLLEIMVIIIGILGAYLLNGWHENVQSSNTEQHLLTGLRSEFVKNKEQLAIVIEHHELSNSSTEQILFMFNNESYEFDSLIRASLFEFFTTFDPGNGFLKSSISSGTIGHIKNKELVTLLSEFEALNLDALEEPERVMDITMNKLSPRISNYISLNTDYWVSRPKSIVKDFPVSNFQRDLPGLFNDRKIEYWMVQLAFWQKVAIAEEKTLISTMETIIQLIDKEIE